MTVLCVAHDDDLGRAVLRAATTAGRALGTGVVVATPDGAVPRGGDVDIEGVEVVTLPEHQDEADAVLDLCVERGSVLLVVGVRRRSPVGKFLLGSAAQQLILEAEVPVLAVKAPRGA